MHQCEVSDNVNGLKNGDFDVRPQSNLVVHIKLRREPLPCLLARFLAARLHACLLACLLLRLLAIRALP
jgi:hypothetical protein